ncbi:3'-5' exonuclease [Agrobacterium vitis]|uniref:DNA polymerase III subunit epsilon n=1 Tax=Agrobacterium vitis TaxID=373 RepID=A0A109CTQ8_AGRVI|nr:3'-5' exonuclease [Agrobacterium vitis]KAA3512765.1 DNA polymerase III subunit epsilon [Agrobacterium vitis]KAA3526183.1 DNA polymerase III subunit epsilon [Agrobacterium vitis]MCE6073752.1 DNA polymerase III subunit epsilon [Agrobacterium vitis]MCF1478238.1 3'-5' exonuclease [Agrobacterium vitis]MCM2449441.1 3'-5' exonuclease [Agrobacterium vitis]
MSVPLQPKIIAIDFETANEERGSACSVGLAFVENGEVVRVEERLIRPKTMRFSSFNIAIHGIRPDHVEDAGEFPEVMDEFADDFAGAMVVAHNAAFDLSVWRACCDLYRQPYPSLSYVCSVKLAQKVWPQLPSHRLNILAAHLQLSFRHHNAAEDASVCAQAVIAMMERRGTQDLGELAGMMGLSIGRLFPGGYQSCSVRKPARVPA